MHSTNTVLPNAKLISMLCIQTWQAYPVVLRTPKLQMYPGMVHQTTLVAHGPGVAATLALQLGALPRSMLARLTRHRLNVSGVCSLQASRMLDSATASSPVAATAAATDDSLKTLLQTVRASSLNCYAFEPMADDSLETRASLLTARWELRDPCTFRIILRSVTDLSKPEVQEAAVAKMDNLVGAMLPCGEVPCSPYGDMPSLGYVHAILARSA